jgi:hypothetical protein
MSKPKLHYITIATKPNENLDLFIKKRLTRQGEQITILGEKENRNIGWLATANFGVKIKEVYYYIWGAKLHENDIVLFTDAYDVVYCGNQEQLIERYLEFGKPIIFGAEKYCNPDPQRASEYAFKNLEFPYLNSGLYIGRVWALRECLLGYQYNDSDDDQRFWTSKFLSRPDLITLDYYNSIFLNTAGIPINTIKWDGHRASYNKYNPLFVHVNGPDKTDLQYFL